MNKNNVNKESKNVETARDKGVNSTDLLYKKTSLTVDELLEEFKTQQKAVRQNQELKRRIALNPLGQEFPFQCSCGAKHLFWYIENKEGIRYLTV